jgi:biotin synthase-related radical SAM superfamily protein
MQGHTSDKLRLTKGQLAIFNDIDRRVFYLAEVLEVLPDYEYKIRFQIETETETGYESVEKIVWQRYLAKLSRFIESVGIARRPGL